ncbi:hypothetical protein ABZ605_28050 [Streptomyces sp. NPDC012765]|uniref:hypothetical protein n=1 Tax=Streptomyces sp. NPDC012765 TaxID=3155249 RepID=UPI0033F8271C
MAEMTVANLIAKLAKLDPEAPVRLATQPTYPFEHAIGAVEQDALGTCWIAEGEQLDYLGGEARHALGWNRY